MREGKGPFAITGWMPAKEVQMNLVLCIVAITLLSYTDFSSKIHFNYLLSTKPVADPQKPSSSSDFTNRKTLPPERS